MSFNLEANPFATVRDVSDEVTTEPIPSGVNFRRQNTAWGFAETSLSICILYSGTNTG